VRRDGELGHPVAGQLIHNIGVAVREVLGGDHSTAGGGFSSI
jgi:hypothetical protein